MTNNDKLFIPVVLGTAREGRESEHVARYLSSVLEKEEGIRTELVDVRDVTLERTLPGWEEHSEVQSWRKVAREADGYIIVSPEYNHGYPGELKQLLDSAYEEYFHKPVGLVGVSSGRLAGARVVEHLKPVLIELGMTVVGRSMYFGNVQDMFEGDTLKSEHADKVEKSYGRMMEYMRAYAEGMRSIRSSLT